MEMSIKKLRFVGESKNPKINKHKEHSKSEFKLEQLENAQKRTLKKQQKRQQREKEKLEKEINKSRVDAIIDDVLDFHGLGILSKIEIQNKVYDFINKALLNNYTAVRIITGRGNNSGKRSPVIKPQVKKMLQEMEQSNDITSFKMSNEGQFDVFF